MSLYESLTRVLAPFAQKIKGIQTGYDGTQYNSPGEAVRSQISDLHVLIGDEPGTAIVGTSVSYDGSDSGLSADNMQGAVDEVADELSSTNERLAQLDALFSTKQTTVPTTSIVGYRYKISGELVEYSTATAWEFSANPNSDYIVQGLTVGTNTMMPILFLDTSDNIISAISDAVQESGHKVPFTTPSGCVKVCYTTATNATWDASPVTIIYAPLSEQAPIASNTEAITNLSTDVSDLKKEVSGEFSVAWVENEYVVTATGAFAHYNGWKRSDYIDVGGDDTVRISNNGTANSNNCFYDANKNRVSAFNNTTGVLAVPATAKYMCVSIETASEIKIFTTEKEETAKQIEDLKKEYLPTIPTYYENYIDSKIATIRSHESNFATGDSFIFVTDQHYPRNTGNAPALIQKIMRETGVRFVVSGGDVNNNSDGVNVMKAVVHDYINRIKTVFPMLNVVGNHEWYTNVIDTSKARPTEGDLYATMQMYAEDKYVSIGPLNSFVVDNEVKRIRYILVSCDFDTNTTSDQIAWFLTELSKVPNGYTLIVIGHAFMSDSMVSIRGSHTDFCNGIDALKTKSTYTYNGVAYDYTDKDVTIPCILTGHTHIDGNLLTSEGIRIICTTTDSAELNYELVEGIPTLSARASGTTNEQAFDVIQFDFSNRKIYCTRIGYGSDREFSY